MFDKVMIQNYREKNIYKKRKAKYKALHGIENRFYYWTQTRRLPQEFKAG
jgi:hypothetical protein